MHMSGWVPVGPGIEPFGDWVILRMTVAALALPDVTMARGTYPVPVAMPYVSGQEGVGVVTDAAPAPARPAREAGGRGVHPALREPRAGVGGHLDHVRGAGLDVRRGRRRVHDPRPHRVARGAPPRARCRRARPSACSVPPGGLGAAIVQLCVAAGCDVVAVVGGAEKAAVVEELGARAVDHSAGDVVEGVRAATDGRGLDVIVDPVQGETGARLRDLLVPDGRHVLCGHAGGLIAHDPHFYVRNHTLVGATLGGYPRQEMRRIHDETQERIEALVAEGRYRPLVSRCVDFADVPAAVTDLAERRTWGRVVVRI